MEDVDALTYSDINELLRGERGSTDLEELTPATLKKISAYIAAKMRLLDNEPGGTFSRAKERSKILSEIDNAQQALRDLFERRQSKVINRALYAVRTDSKLMDTTNMLENEEALYGELLKHLKKSFDYFAGVLEGEEFEASDKAGASKAKKSTTLVKFLDAIPELIDTELEKHGPFAVDDEAELPKELAALLVRQEKAKEI